MKDIGKYIRLAVIVVLAIGILLPSSTLTVKAQDQIEYSLSVNIIGNGVVTVNGSSPYAAGSVVVMTAYPDSGWTFGGWTGDLVRLHVEPGQDLHGREGQDHQHSDRGSEDFQ